MLATSFAHTIRSWINREYSISEIMFSCFRFLINSLDASIFSALLALKYFLGLFFVFRLAAWRNFFPKISFLWR